MKQVNYNKNEKLNWMRLIRSENIGARTFNQLLSIYGSAAAALENIGDMANKGGLRRKITLASEEAVYDEIDKIERYGARIICSYEDGYPELLRSLTDAPPLLTILGSIPKNKTVAIVGARNASLNGRNFARKLAGDLAEKDVCVVSGLAKGIDTYAHIGSLEAGPVAVIAGGIDHIYPAENEKLYWQIAENGAVIAELPFGSAPLARHFPQRNRIIAGMSIAVAVIEAARQSGSLITAENARSYARKVFAVPGSPLDARAAGTNFLLRNGADILESAEDITSYLSRQQNILGESDSLGYTSANISCPDEAQLAKYRKILHDALGYSPISLDLIADELNIPMNILNILTLEMELAGRLERLYGNKVCLIGEC